jgi:AraC-like DNA-binding protein
MAKTGLLFTLRLTPIIGAMLARRGVAVEPLLTQAGVPIEAISGEVTAPLARVQMLMELAAEALGTDQFGILLAGAMPSGSYGVAEFLVRSAPTLGESLKWLCEFSSLINPISNMRMVVTETEGEFHYAVGSERDMLGLYLNEFSISYLVRQFKAVQGNELPLTRVWFAHARTAGAEDVARHFGCPMRFQAADCGFAVTAEMLATPLRTAEPTLFAWLLQQARAQLARSGELDIVTHLVRVLERRLSTDELGSEEVARSMAMTSRTLQRRLVAAGTSYREVLAHVRARRRSELLGSGMTEGEVAKHLGFSDVRAMRRSLELE